MECLCTAKQVTAPRVMGRAPTRAPARKGLLCVTMEALRELPPILLAEDQEDDRILLERALKKAHIDNRVVGFDNGADLKDFLEHTHDQAGEERPAWTRLLLLDLKMPLVDGFEVLEWMPQHPPLKEITTVVISSSERPEDIARAKRLGAAEYIVKPASPEAIAAVVARYLKPQEFSIDE